jgi:hypothetical protein
MRVSRPVVVTHELPNALKSGIVGAIARLAAEQWGSKSYWALLRPSPAQTPSPLTMIVDITPEGAENASMRD